MSISYELAKQLKDAGLSQKEFSLSQPFSGQWPPDIAPAYWPYNPTLEELIEACGAGLELFHHHSDWFAAVQPQGTASVGKTPTEAVARLWLALRRATMKSI